MSEDARVAIVTGAAGGIGRKMVDALLDVGIRVAATDRDAEPLEALAAEARARGQADALRTVAADLSRDSAIDEIIAAATGRFGPVDILVNNAGILAVNWQQPLKFWEVTLEEWRLAAAVHNIAPLALARALAPDMARRGWGRIVNVTTSLGTMLNAGFPTYGPSKAALEAMSAIWAKDLDGTGVTVNVLVPGGVTNTPMVGANSGFERSRMIQPEVMVPPLLWLLSDAAGHVTGRRFLAIHWDPDVPPAEAAERAGAPVAWTRIATMPLQPDIG